jgi:hypothetical protein
VKREIQENLQKINVHVHKTEHKWYKLINTRLRNALVPRLLKSPLITTFKMEEQLQLELVQILTRHGFRTPITLIPHDKDRWECERFMQFAENFKALTFGI